MVETLSNSERMAMRGGWICTAVEGRKKCVYSSDPKDRNQWYSTKEDCDYACLGSDPWASTAGETKCYHVMPIEFVCISREGLGEEFNGSFASYTGCSDKTVEEIREYYGGVWKDEESWDTKYPLTGRTPIPYNRTTYAKGTLLKYSGVIVNDLNQSCGKTCGQGFKTPIEFYYQNFDALSRGYLDMNISGWKEMIDVITSSGDPRRI